MLEGEPNRRLRRLASFIVSVCALVVALALMAVADHGGPIPGPQGFGQNSARGVVPRVPSTQPPETPVARPRSTTPPTTAPPTVPPAVPVAVQPTPPAPVDVPVPAVNPEPRLVDVVLPDPAPSTTVPPAAPTTVPRRTPPSTTPPKVPVRTPPHSVVPPKQSLGVGRDEHGGQGGDDRDDHDGRDRHRVNRGQQPGDALPGQGRTGDRASRSGGPHQHRGTPATCRSRSY